MKVEILKKLPDSLSKQSRTFRIIPKEQQDKREANWQVEMLPNLLQMLQKENPKIWNFIISTPMESIDSLFGSCYLHGSVGTGKSIQAAWRMIEWSRLKSRQSSLSNTKAIFVNANQLLDEVKNSYSTNTSEDVIEKYRKISLLVLDDLGAYKLTDWVYQILYSIIEWRCSHEKPIIYTSNYDLKELEKYLDDQRLPSRIGAECKGNIFNFTGESFRK